MPLETGSGSDERIAVGTELVRYLTRDASELAPRIAALTRSAAEALVAQAARHTVGPLLRNRLIEQGLFDALPPSARDDLDRQYFSGSARAMARHHDLGVLVDRLTEARIPVVALKGVYLANAVYPEPGLRDMADMDLLFRRQHLDQVQTLLFGLGYTREQRERPVGDYLGTGHQLPCFSREGGSRIEVHMDIESPDAPFSIDLDGVWRRARSWSLNGRTLLALSPEDLLLHLCLHGMYHHNSRIGLNALTDIELVARRETLDWGLFGERARSWRAQGPAFLGLALAHRLVSANIPAAVLADLSPRGATDEALRLAEQTMLVERPESRQDDPLRAENGQKLAYNYLRKLRALRDLPGGGSKLAFLFSKAFPSKSSLEYQYPRLAGSRWLASMYLVHWLVLASRLFRAMRMEGWRLGKALSNFDKDWFS